MVGGGRALTANGSDPVTTSLAAWNAFQVGCV